MSRPLDIDLEALLSTLAGPEGRDLLAGPRGPELARVLLDERALEWTLAPPLPLPTLLALGVLRPRSFLWELDPSALGEGPALRSLGEALDRELRDGDAQVALRWLRHRRCLTDERAVELIEGHLRRAEAGTGWPWLAALLQALAARGAGWRAGRLLMDLLHTRLADDRDAEAVFRAARHFPSAAVLRALGTTPPWSRRRGQLVALAAALDTDELLRAFIADLPRAADTEELRVRRIAWAELARRDDEESLDACCALVVRAAPAASLPHEATRLADAILDARGAAGLGALCRSYLAGLQRTAAGERIEVAAARRPLLALSALLQPLPPWLPAFDAAAARHLAAALIPRLESAERSALRGAAQESGGTPQTVLAILTGELA